MIRFLTNYLFKLNIHLKYKESFLRFLSILKLIKKFHLSYLNCLKFGNFYLNGLVFDISIYKWNKIKFVTILKLSTFINEKYLLNFKCFLKTYIKIIIYLFHRIMDSLSRILKWKIMIEIKSSCVCPVVSVTRVNKTDFNIIFLFIIL